MNSNNIKLSEFSINLLQNKTTNEINWGKMDINVLKYIIKYYNEIKDIKRLTKNTMIFNAVMDILEILLLIIYILITICLCYIFSQP